MLVRVCLWPGRYRREVESWHVRRHRALEDSVALLAADAADELGLPPSPTLHLAAERVWVWCGRHRVTSRTYRSALEVLPLVVAKHARDLAAVSPPDRERSQPAR